MYIYSSKSMLYIIEFYILAVFQRMCSKPGEQVGLDTKTVKAKLPTVYKIIANNKSWADNFLKHRYLHQGIIDYNL